LPVRPGKLLAVLGVIAVFVVACAAPTAPLPSANGRPPATVPSALVLTVASSPSLVAVAAATPSPSSSARPSLTFSAPPSPTSSASWIFGLPRPDLTPGATNSAVNQADVQSTICVAGWTATVRPPESYTTALKVRQIAQYGYTDTATKDYEEDHLVSLELGGNPTDVRNLWPEPYTATLPDGTEIGARVKDRLENELNDLVCSGAEPLTAAQQAIATDWLGTYETLETGQTFLSSP